jgi:hypothetical protein
MKLYRIEYIKSESIYRFRSLFNNCKGPGRILKEEAEEDGEKHQIIIVNIYPAARALVEEES